MKKLLMIGLLSVGSISAANAQITSNFESTATLNGFCSITAQDASIGNVRDYTGEYIPVTVTALCSNNANYRVAINGGLNYSSSYRRMRGTIQGNNDNIAYRLHYEASAASTWEPGVNRTIKGNGSEQSVPVFLYGINYANNYYKTPDIYSDNLTITVTY